MRTLSCPYCSFSKDVPAGRIPPRMKAAICPKCKRRFPLETPPTKTAPVAPDNSQPLTITCPRCGVKKVMPGDRLPARKVKLRCQACAQAFIFEGRRRSAGAATRTPAAAPAPLKTADHPVLAGRSPDLQLSTAMRRRHLSGSRQLLGKAWRAYARRLPTLLGLNLIAAPGAVVAWLILASGTDLIPELLGEGSIATWLSSGFQLLFAAMLASWVGAANTLAVSDDELGALATLLLATQRARGFFLVFLPAGLMIAGGLLLLVLPGLCYATWFGLAPLIHLREDRPGLEALLKSRAYVKKRPELFSRLCLPVLTAGLVNLLLLLAPFLGLLLLVPLIPLLFTYLNTVYDELDECGDTLIFTCALGEKLRLLAIGAIGCLLALLLMAGAFGPTSMDILASIRQHLPFQSQGTSRLELTQDSYAPGEILTVTVTVPANFPWDAWIGVLPARVPHGDEAVNQQQALSYQHLEGRTRGAFHFRVPNEPGIYDLRIHDRDVNGRETASVSFRVVASN